MAGKFGNLPGAGPGRPKGIKNGEGKAAIAKNKREAKKTEKEMNALFKDVANLTLQLIAPYIYRYLAQAYISAINYFYGHYNPKTYVRTYQTQLRNFNIKGTGTGQGPVRKYIKNLKGGKGTIEAGIDISTDYYTNPSPYKIPKDTVFRNTFEEGIHGRITYYKKAPDGSMNIETIEPLIPPPADILESYLKSYAEDSPFEARYKNYLINKLVNETLPKAIEKVAKSNKYKVR